MKCNLDGYRVEIDEKATQSWYEQAGIWACSCAHCRNFVKLAQAHLLPADVLEILSALHIPPEKATYVCELYTDEAGVHYQFSYRVAGTYTESPPRQNAAMRCCHEPYPYGAPGFPEPHFDVEFYAVLPFEPEENT